MTVAREYVVIMCGTQVGSVVLIVTVSQVIHVITTSVLHEISYPIYLPNPSNLFNPIIH